MLEARPKVSLSKSITCVGVMSSATANSLAEISGRLRRERELAFYGDLDFIPTEQYTAADAQRAYDEAAWVATLAARAIDALKA